MDGAFRHQLDRVDVAIVAKAPIEQFTAWRTQERLARIEAGYGPGDVFRSRPGSGRAVEEGRI